jgi:hypothetical protein
VEESRDRSSQPERAYKKVRELEKGKSDLDKIELACFSQRNSAKSRKMKVDLLLLWRSRLAHLKKEVNPHNRVWAFQEAKDLEEALSLKVVMGEEEDWARREAGCDAEREGGCDAEWLARVKDVLKDLQAVQKELRSRLGVVVTWEEGKKDEKEVEKDDHDEEEVEKDDHDEEEVEKDDHDEEEVEKDDHDEEEVERDDHDEEEVEREMARVEREMARVEREMARLIPLGAVPQEDRERVRQGALEMLAEHGRLLIPRGAAVLLSGSDESSDDESSEGRGCRLMHVAGDDCDCRVIYMGDGDVIHMDDEAMALALEKSEEYDVVARALKRAKWSHPMVGMA